MLFLDETSSILPPEDNGITFALVFTEFSRTVNVSSVLPEILVVTTNVLESSISGNTDETLTVLENSVKTNAKVIPLSSGGKMEEVSSKNSIPYFKINQTHSNTKLPKL
jgi:hypothetical protein